MYKVHFSSFQLDSSTTLMFLARTLGVQFVAATADFQKPLSTNVLRNAHLYVYINKEFQKRGYSKCYPFRTNWG
jgi:hypothetical protein